MRINVKVVVLLKSAFTAGKESPFTGIISYNY